MRFDSPRHKQQSHEGLVGGAAQGSADCRRNWTTALIPRSSGIGTHPTSAQCVEAARIAWGLNTQLMLLKKEKDPTSKQFDDDEWMGEFSRRLLALGEGEIAALTTSMRQIGVCTPGGAEALAIFHQLLHDEWMTGSLSGPLARIKVDEKNCFGMIEWQAVREAAVRFLSKHTAAGAWKHRNVSHVEQEGLPPMPKDRGAEQGDVDGT